jgi:adenylate cyclase
MTPSEYAKNATAALQKVLHISPSEFNAEGAAAVIEEAIRNATGERGTRAHRDLREVQSAAQERVSRLLSASPAVVYSFKATGDYAPTFVSDNIIDVFGYAPAEYLEDALFWRDRVHPDDLARVEEAIAKFFQNGVHASGVSLSPQRWLVFLGERRTTRDRRCRRQAVGDRRVLERRHGA